MMVEVLPRILLPSPFLFPGIRSDPDTTTTITQHGVRPAGEGDVLLTAMSCNLETPK